MNSPLKTFSIGVITACGLAASAISAQAQNASATISGTPDGGNFDYTITLHNTGLTVLNSFWYGWTQSGNNLPSNPSTAGNSLGWGNFLSGNSIEWINSSGLALAPGGSATFTFVDVSTPIAITTPPSGDSVAYVGGIDFSQGVAGDSTGVFSPVLQAAPEPSTLGLMAVGLFALLFRAAPAVRPWLRIPRK
jgi:hypothetical protein